MLPHSIWAQNWTQNTKKHVLWRLQGYGYTLWAREIGNFAYLVSYDGFSRGRVLSHLILNISSLDSPILEIQKLEYSRHIYLSNDICYSYIVEVFHLWVLHLRSCTQKLPILTYKNNTITSQHAFDMFLLLQICIEMVLARYYKHFRTSFV